MNKFFIYKLTFKSGKCYIGITSNLKERLQTHCLFAKKNKPYKISRAINKYYFFSVEILEICNSKHIAFELEKKYINLFNSYNCGYNSTIGGDGVFGYIYNDLDRQKISKGVSRYVNSLEGKLQRSETMKKVLAKNNWTKNQIRPWKSKKVKCTKTGQIFASQKECAKVRNLDKGYLWKCIKQNKPAKGIIYEVYNATI